MGNGAGFVTGSSACLAAAGSHTAPTHCQSAAFRSGIHPIRGFRMVGQLYFAFGRAGSSGLPGRCGTLWAAFEKELMAPWEGATERGRVAVGSSS